MTEQPNDEIVFLLNGPERIALRPDPDLTILEWLRLQRRLTGTKEGCAEGDCGACTVALGETSEGRLRIRAVNACIAMMSQLHGKMLVTVEGLAEGRALHPVQQAMVENHASQCGFCTPGFVMALFARFHEGPAPDVENIHDTIAGNLCRCTGYRPIVDAALQALGADRTDRFSRMEMEITTALASIAQQDAGLTSGQAIGKVTGDAGVTFMPRTRDQLIALLREHAGAPILAGGTDIGLDITKRGKRWPVAISLAAMDELKSIVQNKDSLRIGAAATYTDLLPHFAHYGDSALVLLRRLGSTQIRNMGTMGGNIANASPIGDTPPMLLALDARVTIDGVNGERSISIDDFFVGYRKTALQTGEYVAFIDIPAMRPDAFFHIDKISRRFDQDISAVCGAIHLQLAGGVIASARVAFGGMADKPKRATQAERALTGASLTPESFESAAQALPSDFAPISDFRASADYRMSSAQNLIRRWGMLACSERTEAAE